MLEKKFVNALPLKFILLSIVILTGGCTRLKVETSKLSINLPMASSDSSSLALRKTGDVGTLGSQDYGVATPSLSTQLNCYLVFVSGPEASLSGNQCEVAGTTVPVGMVAGFTPAGASITMDVDAGVDRVISLVGLQTDGTVPCPSLGNFDLVKSHISNPVIIGSVGKIQMQAGASVAVDIPMDKNISATKVIGECKGPLFGSFKGGGNGNNGSAPVGYKIITQDNAVDFNSNTCVPMQLKMVDANGNDAGVSNTYSTIITATGGVQLSMTPTCGSPMTNLSSTFSSFNTNSFFALMPGSTGSFQIATTNTSGPTPVTDRTLPTTYNVSTSAGAPYTLNLVDAMTLKTVGPGSTLPLYTCRAFMLQVQDDNHRSYPNATSGSGGMMNISPSGFNYYTDSFCSTTAGSFSIPSSSSLMNASVFGIFTTPSSAITFTPPGMTGTVPATIPNTSFTMTTPPSPGVASQFGFVNSSMTNFNASQPYYVHKPVAGCGYVGEIGYFDAAGVRTVVPASGGITFSGNFGANNLYSNSVATGAYDIGGSGSTVLGIGTGNTVTAYKVPLYACSTSPNGNYTMVVSGYSALTGVIPTTTINFTIGY